MIECEVAREGSRALGSLEKMAWSATPSRVEQLDHSFLSLPLALLEMMCVMVVMGGSITLGSLEKMVRSATSSRVKQLGHIFPSLPLALRKMMCVVVVMEESIASDGIAGQNDATSGTA